MTDESRMPSFSSKTIQLSVNVSPGWTGDVVVSQSVPPLPWFSLHCDGGAVDAPSSFS